MRQERMYSYIIPDCPETDSSLWKKVEVVDGAKGPQATNVVKL